MRSTSTTTYALRCTVFALSVCFGASCGSEASPSHEPDAGRTDAGSAPHDDASTSLDDGGGGVDAGLQDAAVQDARVQRQLPSCAAPRRVDGTFGTVSIPFSTAEGPLGPLDLSDECFAPEARRPPQFVAEYVVPGAPTQEVFLELTTITYGTPLTFDTLFEIRDAGCEATPTAPGHCFDGWAGSDPRAFGTFHTRGGAHLYLVITGFRGTLGAGGAEGSGVLDVTARINRPPALVRAAITIDRTAEIPVAELVFEGADPDGDVDGFNALAVKAYDEGGHPLDLDADGDVDDADTIRPALEMFVQNRTAFRSWTHFELFSGVVPTSFELALVDRTAAWSPSLTVPVSSLALPSAACDEAHACDVRHECDAVSHRCELPRAFRDACTSGVVPVALPALTGEGAAEVAISTDIVTVDDFLDGTCGGSGPERVLAVTIPAGAPSRPYDIVVEATTPPGVTSDPALHVRTTCAERETTSEVACGISPMVGTHAASLSFLPTPATTYYVVADLRWLVYGPTTPVDVRVRARPLLASGAACDPTERENRCATGRCVAGGTARCP